MANHFVITIARGYGSGGKTIGKMLSETLGIPFYDRELFYMASDQKLEHYEDPLIIVQNKLLRHVSLRHRAATSMHYSTEKPF